jgi:hypothetical protein
MGWKKNACSILVGIHEGKRTLLEGTGIDGRIMLKWIVNKYDGARGLASFCSA